ncbi:MAG: DeoR/GlpR transcriptional regulator [Clostridia bacterium]|nr:DeoR/GlpR transcriptional regulator [Clostridia bacterium]
MRTERERDILEILKSEGEVSVESLRKRLFVSEATVRRELKSMESKGLILRPHGKAVLLRGYADKNTGFSERENLAGMVKDRLAQNAVKNCMEEGKVVFLDASSTAMHTVKYLDKYSDVIVITSGIKTLFELSKTSIKHYSTGGMAITASSSLVGQSAIDTVNGFNADVCFVSCHALSMDGYVTDSSVAENDVRRAIMRRSKRKILLVDDSKVGKQCWNNLCHISEFDEVYCNAQLPEDILKSVNSFKLIKA